MNTHKNEGNHPPNMIKFNENPNHKPPNLPLVAVKRNGKRKL